MSHIELVCPVDHNIFTIGFHIPNSTDYHIYTQYSPQCHDTLCDFYYQHIIQAMHHSVLEVDGIKPPSSSMPEKHSA